MKNHLQKNLHSNLHKTADQLRLWLTANGCKVSTSQVWQTPVLAVTGPLPKEMKARAVPSRERIAGVVREVLLVRFGGCLLHWRQ